MSTIFTKIINGEIPSYKIYEDEFTFAFLDIFPQAKWHTLIVPKIEIDHFSNVPEPYYSAIFATAKKLSPALQSATNCQRVCAKFEGFEVPHCHMHLLPANWIGDVNFRVVDQANSTELEQIQSEILKFLK